MLPLPLDLLIGLNFVNFCSLICVFDTPPDFQYFQFLRKMAFFPYTRTPLSGFGFLSKEIRKSTSLSAESLSVQTDRKR